MEMRVNEFIEVIGGDFFVGVPDSQLKALCYYLMNRFGVDAKHHVIAANEGNAVGIAAGYYLSTGKIPVVYMQNSGEGNVINPVASLLNKRVYGIPAIFVIGWRGEPEVKDEPQHVFQGMITEKLLTDLEIEYFILDENTTESSLGNVMRMYHKNLKNGEQVAFIIKKGALSGGDEYVPHSDFDLNREKALELILSEVEESIVVATTGKIGREVFEIRERFGQGHEKDFLTVGSMGHASSIALGIASQKPDVRVCCLDGDGAMLMHMGAMAVIGAVKPKNLIHILINNEAHESVGGFPTVAGNMDVCKVAEACGYEKVECVSTPSELKQVLNEAAKDRTLWFIEVKCAIGSRSDLGRPTITPRENIKYFIKNRRG